MTHMSVRFTPYPVERKLCNADHRGISSTFGKLLPMEHVLFVQIGLRGIHALGEAKVRTFDFNSFCCGDEYVTKG
jgi:hypothetical protein